MRIAGSRGAVVCSQLQVRVRSPRAGTHRSDLLLYGGSKGMCRRLDVLETDTNERGLS